MQKRTIPLLISTMALALIGIIVIQYRWIAGSLDEKGQLVEHKIHQMAANVTSKMSVYNSMAFLTELEFPGDSLIRNSKDDTVTQHIFWDRQETEWQNNDSAFTTISDSIVIKIHTENTADDFPETAPKGAMVLANFPDTNLQSLTPGVHIIRTDSFLLDLDQFLQPEKDSVKAIIADAKSELFKLNEVRSVFDQIRLEVGQADQDARLDSAVLKNKLFEESKALGISPPQHWAVYDKTNKTYAILPKTESEWDFKIPLFKNDILNPNQYQLFLSMSDYSSQIWSEIYAMIGLSILFTAIIIFVFVFAIRLIIKHKKISEIKSDFINNMTHEFKTPLASISLAADSILHPKISGDQEAVHKYIDIIKSEKNKLNRHIETILEVASLRENDVEIPLEPVVIENSVRGALKKLALLIEDRQCKVTTDLPEKSIINGNAYHLENVLTNVIENGIKYSPEKPEITIAAYPSGKTVELRIQDKGIGMSKAQIAKAFDHFYRAQKGNIHNTKGFGLGLSFVRYMVQKMAGTIHIESETGKGTTVIIRFPLSDKTPLNA